MNEIKTKQEAVEYLSELKKRIRNIRLKWFAIWFFSYAIFTNNKYVEDGFDIHPQFALGFWVALFVISLWPYGI